MKNELLALREEIIDLSKELQKSRRINELRRRELKASRGSRDELLKVLEDTLLPEHHIEIYQRAMKSLWEGKNNPPTLTVTHSSMKPKQDNKE